MPIRTSPEQPPHQGNPKIFFRFYVAATLAWGAVYLLEQNLASEPAPPPAGTWQLAGWLAMVCGMLGHIVLRRRGLNDKPAAAIAVVGSLALFPPLWRLLIFIRDPHQTCIVERPDGFFGLTSCRERAPGTPGIVPPDGGHLGLALLAAAAVIVAFTGIGYVLGRTKRRRTVPLRWYLISGVLWSFVPAIQFAVNLANTARPERLWIVLTATATSALGLITCFRWKRQRDQSTERGEGE
ncbi:hypothetical protein LZ318_09090 [Saccharopolyspora indica]|uniref:hypothetical protein n=1 Tax=Saccharopolyspora indica TaxID=1229659 RepID=UPI0022EA5B4D|nr:hypothetical protein [Saccharopolyspora indica]MDA3643489.1 hypothetical protein [Saccharopolyspora indica]